MILALFSTIDRAFALQEGGQISNSRREKPKLLVVTIPLLKGEMCECYVLRIEVPRYTK